LEGCDVRGFVLVAAIIVTAVLAFQIAGRSNAFGDQFRQLAARHSYAKENAMLAAALWIVWLPM
jgi:type II secretory pathway component PulK